MFRAVSAGEELALIEKRGKKKKVQCEEKHRPLLALEPSSPRAFLPYLEELHPDTGEHELEQRGDDNNVADGPDGHKHALHHMLESTAKIKSEHKRCV